MGVVAHCKLVSFAFCCQAAYEAASVELCAELGVPKLSQSHAVLALEPEKTADVKVTARAVANLLHPSTPNAAQTSSYEANGNYRLIKRSPRGKTYQSKRACSCLMFRLEYIWSLLQLQTSTGNVVYYDLKQLNTTNNPQIVATAKLHLNQCYFPSLQHSCGRTGDHQGRHRSNTLRSPSSGSTSQLTAPARVCNAPAPPSRGSSVTRDYVTRPSVACRRGQ